MKTFILVAILGLTACSKLDMTDAKATAAKAEMAARTEACNVKMVKASAGKTEKQLVKFHNRCMWESL